MLGSKSTYFQQDARILQLKRRDIVRVLRDKGYRATEMAAYLDAYDYFCMRTVEYDAELEGSEERITVPLFAYLAENNGEMPEDYVMVDYGYPTYEKVMQYFEGGTLNNPEITISAPLAIGFLMNNLVMNGEAVGVQFTMV